MMQVFWKIKEMSACSAVNPRPMIHIQDLATQLKTHTEKLYPALKELKRQRLIQLTKPGATYIKLTLQGLAVAQ